MVPNYMWRILILIILIMLPILIFKNIMYIFNIMSSFFNKIMNDNKEKDKSLMKEEKLKNIVKIGQEDGTIESDEKEMLLNVFEFSDLQVKDVMIPRVNIVSINKSSTYDEVMKIIKKEKFSRFPVYDQNIDNIIGILNFKDLAMAENPRKDFDIMKYLRETFYTFELKKIADLLKEMKECRNHIAIVIDEYGGTVGIVTIEDLVEEIVGDIEDEYDEGNNDVEVICDNEYLLDGSIKLHDISDLIGININSQEFDSVGGLIIGELGRVPKENEEIELNNIRFIIENVSKNRIKKVRIIINYELAEC